MNHEAYKEWLTSEALGLPIADEEAADYALFREHIAACVECQRELRELRDAAATLAYTVPPVEPAAELRTHILQLAATRPQFGQATTPAPVLPSQSNSNVLFFKRRTILVGAIAASLLLAALTAALFVTRQRLDATRAELDRARRNANLLQSPESRFAALTGTTESPAARARLVLNPRTGETVFISSNLPAPPVGKAYQLWYIAGAQAIPGTVFVPDATGQTVLRTQAPPAGIAADTFAVTLEDARGVDSPQGAKYLTGTAS